MDSGSDSDSDQSDRPSEEEEIMSAIESVIAGHGTTIDAMPYKSIDMDLWTEKMVENGFTMTKKWTEVPMDPDWTLNDDRGITHGTASVWRNRDKTQHVYCLKMDLGEHHFQGESMMMHLEKFHGLLDPKKKHRYHWSFPSTKQTKQIQKTSMCLHCNLPIK
jgi:hypothetical protein